MGTNALFDTRTIQAAEAGMIAPIARWCECLHGCAPFRDALRALAAAINGEAAAVCRVSTGKGRASGSVFFDAAAGEGNGPALDRSFARAVLGGYLDKAKPGLIWYKSMSDQDSDPALDRFHASRRLAELAVIPLSSGRRHTDFLELHFSSRPGAVQQALLNIISDTLVRTWTNRSPGLYTEACLSERRLRRNAEVEAHLLSMENPAQLSRAEYRVCVLLSKGQPAKRVQSDLGISKSTLRTHLRNIYAKTRTSNLTELVYHLVSVDTFAGQSPRRGTAA